MRTQNRETISQYYRKRRPPTCADFPESPLVPTQRGGTRRQGIGARQALHSRSTQFRAPNERGIWKSAHVEGCLFR
jgi:hypothetical protein